VLWAKFAEFGLPDSTGIFKIFEDCPNFKSFLDFLGKLPKFYVIFGILRMLTENFRVSEFFRNKIFIRNFEDFYGLLPWNFGIFWCFGKKLINLATPATHKNWDSWLFLRTFRIFWIFWEYYQKFTEFLAYWPCIVIPVYWNCRIFSEYLVCLVPI
jgi:hypothetical protein